MTRFEHADEIQREYGLAAFAAVEAELAGWIADQASGNSFITEDPMQALSVDDDGYGMTYQFGDGWVTVADVKQSLLLIQRPQG